MSKIRILAIINILLILFMFGMIVAALFIGNYNLFFIAGGVLVAALICGIVTVSVYKKIGQKKEEVQE